MTGVVLMAEQPQQPVPKSKSLSTSMDKLSSHHHQQQRQHQQQRSSRGSTPSSGRSSVGTSSRPPSRRSPAAQQRARAVDGTVEKSGSPCGSEVSLNSGVSSTASVKSLPSVRSSSSASGRSSCELPRTTQPRTVNPQTMPPPATPVPKSSTNTSIRSSRSSTPPDTTKTSPSGCKMSATNNGFVKAKSPPIVATHRKNAVAGRPIGGALEGSPPTGDLLKTRAASTSSVSSSSSPATGNRRMSGQSSDERGGAGQQQSSTPGTDAAKKVLPVFNSYMSLFQVQEKLKKGEVIEGVLRINPKNYEDAYISAPGGGTDIFIGGVRDRNAALHGDLVAVELLPPQHWRVLYDQLDYFLDCDETLKSLVYATHDPFAVMDQFVPPGCVTSKSQQQQQQNKEEQQQQQTPNATCIPTTTTNNNNSASKDADADTTAECNDTSSSNKKKKGRRRGKKNKKDERAESEEVLVVEEEEELLNVAAAEVVAGLLSNPPMENVEDELVILSSNLDNACLSSDGSFEVAKKCSKKAGNRKSKKPAIVVPPDMLSECSDLTDDESCCSDSLDVDTALEDRNFFNAQRAAAKKARQCAGHTVSSAGVTIVEVTEEQAQAINVEEATIKKERTENEERDEKQDVKLENETDKELLSGAPSKCANVKKRTSTVESLFGDKLKDKTASNRSGKKNKKNRTSQDNDTTAVDVIVEAANTSQQSKQSVASDTHDSSASKPAAGEVKVEPPNVSLFTCIGDDDSKTTVPAACGTAPRFMVSPYNHQVNFSHPMGRAENNWLHHPMLNNFSNNPMAGVGRFTSPQQHGNYRPRQQNQNNRPHRQDQQQQFESNQRSEPNVAKVMRLANWDRFIQKVAYVVHIFERRNTRLGAGTLKPFADMNRNFALFSPNDSRIPRMKIPMSQCPPDLLGRKEEYSKRIYLAKIALWNDPKFALGELVRDIGRQGDINAESEAFLLQIGIDYSDFPEEVLADLPAVPVQGWTIPPEAMEGRKDLRSQCIFSVDPATARDLDDALSCEVLPGGHYRVGVHIADVSHFVALDTELDKMAATRATSVYLVNRVIPMLPRLLCEQLCSLNPDEDRLSFSVIWEMDRCGQVQSTWFGRTIIQSCAKLSYEHAQSIIENPGKIDWAPEEMPPVSRFPVSQVCQVITMLHSLAVQMRARRHNNGALRLDQNKLGFSLDSETKLPNAVHITEHRQSNQLIEEFMLLANISVAHKIYESFPQLAVLRCHPEPPVGQLQDIVNLLRTLNIEIDSTCAGSIYASLMEVAGEGRLSEARLEVIVNMLSKPMQNALYFCSGTYKEDFAHYALNVPFYTHFTSPIRRYPDIMVHRLLAAAIDSDRYPVPGLSQDEIDRRCSISNEKKMSAKRASEYSNELYLAEFVRQVREIHTDGIIIGVLDRALDVLLLDYCTIKRTYLERLPLEELNYDNKNKNEPPAVHVVWSPDHANQLPSTAQSFTYFTLVKVVLTPFTNDQLKFNVTLVRPDS